jgi:hypothetical protein
MSGAGGAGVGSAEGSIATEVGDTDAVAAGIGADVAVGFDAEVTDGDGRGPEDEQAVRATAMSAADSHRGAIITSP